MNINIKRQALGRHSQRLMLVMNKMMRLIDLELKYLTKEDARTTTGCYLITRSGNELTVFAMRQHTLYSVIGYMDFLKMPYAYRIRKPRKQAISSNSPCTLEDANYLFERMEQEEDSWDSFERVLVGGKDV